MAAPRHDGPKGVDAGRIYGIVGNASGTLSIASAGSQVTLRIDGEAAGDGLGGAGIAMLDFNGDGIEDLATSASTSDPNGNANAGAAYVTFNNGRDNIVDRFVLRIQGAAAGDNLGLAIVRTSR